MTPEQLANEAERRWHSTRDPFYRDTAEALRDTPDTEPMRCAECWCQNGGAECEWIATPDTDTQAAERRGWNAAIEAVGQLMVDEAKRHRDLAVDQYEKRIDYWEHNEWVALRMQDLVPEIRALQKDHQDSTEERRGWNGPGETPHDYAPDHMAQGDCKVCGHTAQAHEQKDHSNE